MTEEPWRRTVQCVDGAQRHRAFVLTISENGQTPLLALQAPPGEFGLLTLAAIRKMKAVLAEAEREIAERGLSRS